MNGGNRLVTSGMRRSVTIRSWLVTIVVLLMMFATGSVGLHAQTSEAEDQKSATEETESAGDRRQGSADPDEDAYERARESDDSTIRRLRKGSEPLKAVSNPNVSPLVKAAAANSSRKESVRSFTDADLASAKGKIIRVEGTNVREPEIIPIEKRPTTAAHEDSAARSQQLQNQIAAKALRAEIAELEKDLRRIESDYYLIEQEDHREQVERSFAAKQKALADAREKLKALESGGR